MKSLFAFLFFLSFFCIPSTLHAQLPYNQAFKNSTAPEVVMSGSASLTAATGIDPEGDGYLRLTDNATNLVGYAIAKNVFPSLYGLTTTFEFYTYKSNANGFNQADGISFFLFDATVNAFRPGGLGGSLGYAQYYSKPGMTKGYLGIGIDEYGNFSNPTEGRNGGIGRKAGSVVVRGPGDGNKTTDYLYVSSVQTDQAPYNIPISKFTQRYPDYTSPNYRRIKIILTPGSSLGIDKGFTITVTMYKGGTPTGTEVTLINNFDYPYLAPSQLRYGFAASTGSNTDFHEIRSLSIVPTNTGALLAPTAANDNVAVCQGPKALLDVTANDLSNNLGGSISKDAIDLDPGTTGIQNMYTDAGKGTYTADQNGIVTFTPVSGFIGNSLINYTVNDNYGKTSGAATISVTVSSILGPSLTVTDPSGVCSPTNVDITNSSLRSNTTPGATYNYFSNLTDANKDQNNINATANAISSSGLYFIRANSGVCYVVQPVIVLVSQKPTTSVAGSSQSLCNPGGTTLSANDPTVGTGVWSQVSGPSTASFVTPSFSNSSVTNLQNGTYKFRWTISNGACTASTSDVVVTLANAAVAGSDQSLTNATTTTMQANDPAPGTGLWSQVSGASAIITTPASPTTTVKGLAAGNSYTFKWTITNGCSTSSQMLVAVSSTLPVRLLSFTGEKQKEGVLLKWRTASEKENDYFVVEKSSNGIEYDSIGKVAGAGNAAAENAYSFFDKENNTESAVRYYRLKQVDIDGKTIYSSIVKVNGDASAKQDFALWPNPFKTSVNIVATFEESGNATLRLYDHAGRLVLQQQRAVIKGKNLLLIQLPEKSSKGVYVLEIEKGEEKRQQKIVKE